LYKDSFVLFQTDLNNIWRGLYEDGVVSGLNVTPVGGMSLEISSGTARVGGKVFRFTVPTTIVLNPGSTEPRKDLLYIDYSNENISSLEGVPEGANPSDTVGPYTKRPRPGTLSSLDLLLYEVWVEANASSITSSDITDRRVLRKYIAPFNVINVLDMPGSNFGEQLQNAINMATSFSVIIIPSGEYTLSTTISLRTDIDQYQIIGVGRPRIILDSTLNGSTIFNIGTATTPRADHFWVKNIWFEGATVDTTVTLFYFKGRESGISDCVFKNFKGTIWEGSYAFASPMYHYFLNNLVDHCYPDNIIRFYGGTDNYIRWNQVKWLVESGQNRFSTFCVFDSGSDVATVVEENFIADCETCVSIIDPNPKAGGFVFKKNMLVDNVKVVECSISGGQDKYVRSFQIISNRGYDGQSEAPHTINALYSFTANSHCVLMFNNNFHTRGSTTRESIPCSFGVYASESIGVIFGDNVIHGVTFSIYRGPVLENVVHNNLEDLHTGTKRGHYFTDFYPSDTINWEESVSSDFVVGNSEGTFKFTDIGTVKLNGLQCKVGDAPGFEVIVSTWESTGDIYGAYFGMVDSFTGPGFYFYIWGSLDSSVNVRAYVRRTSTYYHFRELGAYSVPFTLGFYTEGTFGAFAEAKDSTSHSIAHDFNLSRMPQDDATLSFQVAQLYSGIGLTLALDSVKVKYPWMI